MEVAGLSPDVVDIMGGVWQEPFFETAFRDLQGAIGVIGQKV